MDHENTSAHVMNRRLLFVAVCGCASPTKVDTGPYTTYCEETTWYQDADGDGYGDPGVAETSCSQPAGSVPDGTDCDDADANTYPDAPELCMDGRPNDCTDADGALAAAECESEGPFDLAWSDAKLLGDVEAAYSVAVGTYVSGLGDMNGDGRDDMLISVNSAFSGAVVSGPVSGHVSLADADAWIVGYVLLHVRPANDIDQDGYTDLIAGEGDSQQSAWLIDGPLMGDVSVDDYPALYSDHTYQGSDDYAGKDVGAPGDLNGDGWGDLLVGAPKYGAEGVESADGWCPGEIPGSVGAHIGAVYVVYGPITGTRDLAGSNGLLFGESSMDSAGSELAPVGDVDGDGLADVFLEAGGQCEGGDMAGAAYLVLGPASGSQSLEDAAMKLRGTTGDGGGMVVAGAGDTNGDGYADLLVGTKVNESADYGSGRANLVLGPPGADRALADSDAHWVGSDSGYVGVSVASAGDMDGDGQDDVLIGAYGHTDRRKRGATALSYGPVEGTLQFSELKTVFLGPNPDDYAGDSLSSAGDVDADGRLDLLIGAPGDDEAGEWAGAAYLVLGGGAFLNGGYGP